MVKDQSHANVHWILSKVATDLKLFKKLFCFLPKKEITRWVIGWGYSSDQQLKISSTKVPGRENFTVPSFYFAVWSRFVLFINIPLGWSQDFGFLISLGWANFDDGLGPVNYI